MSWLVRIAHWTQPNFFQLAAKSNRIQLITLFLSHYVELARWSLLLKNIPFDEYACSPGSHVLPVLSVRVDRKGKRYESASSRPGSATKKGGMTSVPIAVLPSGKLLLDSWDIAAFSGLDPIEDDLKRILDEEVGPHARLLAYSYLLKPSNKAAFDHTFTNNRGYFYKFIWWLFFGRYLHNSITKLFKIDDITVVNASRNSLKLATQRIDEMLLEKKSKYMNGSDTFPGIADVAIASLFAIVVDAPGYADGAIEGAFQVIRKVDPTYQAELDYWRNTETGKFTIAMYHSFRTAKPLKV